MSLTGGFCLRDVKKGRTTGFCGLVSVKIVLGVVVLQTLVLQASTLNITKLLAPRIADPRNDMQLQCYFDMGSEQFFGVKWYKDGQEFIRYAPSMEIKTLKFDVSGVQVVSDSDFTDCRIGKCNLLLSNLSRKESTGEYKCEVSTEAPSFRTAARTANVTVAALPKEKPRIEDLADSYEVGDHLNVRCISAPGDPKPQLSFYINKQQVALKYVKEIPPYYQAGYPKQRVNLETRQMQLRIPLERRHWNSSGAMELECVSIVPGLPPDVSSKLSTIKVVPLIDHNYINNQKLHWPSNFSSRHYEYVSMKFLVLVVFVRWW